MYWATMILASYLCIYANYHTYLTVSPTLDGRYKR